MGWQQIGMFAGGATVGAPSFAPIARGAGASGALCAGGVTAGGGCGAQSVAGLGGTRSAELVEAAGAWLDADAAWWSSMTRGPFNEHKGADHWQLADEAARAWASYTAALAGAGVEVGDRRELALELTGAGKVSNGEQGGKCANHPVPGNFGGRDGGRIGHPANGVSDDD